MLADIHIPTHKKQVINYLVYQIYKEQSDLRLRVPKHVVFERLNKIIQEKF